MSFFDGMILDLILILFPILSLLIVKANFMNIGKFSSNFFIDIANLSSLFLLIKYCDSSNYYMILLVNIPFIISVLHGRRIVSFIIAICLILFNVSVGSDVYFLIIEYSIYLIIFILLFKKGISIETILLTFVFIKGIFLTIHECYILNNLTFLSILKIFVCLSIFYLIGILIVNIIDLTDRTVTLNQSLKELEKEKKLKNSLFKITHEVKNPIAVCKGYLQMMDYSNIDKIKKYNKIILNELNRTLDIMDNFSEFTKIKVNLDIMDVDYLIVDTIKSMYSVFKLKNISVYYDESDEVFIDGDFDRLKQVLINILKNSVEALDGGGTINISLKRMKRYARISIRDDGCGISKEDLNKISELFYSTKDKGCGIGVSLSKEIIALHNGFIKYNSVEGSYTEVVIKLPLHLFV